MHIYHSSLNVYGHSRTKNNILLLQLKQQYTAVDQKLASFFPRSKVDQLQDIVTGNPTVIKMVVSFNRGARGHNALRSLLGPVVKDLLQDRSLGINTSPVDVYKSWVNQLETSMGEVRYSCGAQSQ